jgi:hypothetical protein
VAKILFDRSPHVTIGFSDEPAVGVARLLAVLHRDLVSPAFDADEVGAAVLAALGAHAAPRLSSVEQLIAHLAR